jgi:hypothetical protein
MKKVVLILFFIQIASSLIAIEESDFCVVDSITGNRIFLDDPIEKIIKFLGEPLENIRVKSGNPGFYHLKYDGVVFGYNDNKRTISVIFINSERFNTTRNISVGNNRCDVLNKYGVAEYSNNELLVYSMEKESEKPWLEEKYGIYFHFDNKNFIDEITIQS